MASRKRAASTSVAEAVVLEMPKLIAGLPPTPRPELDPVLDAAARCFARFGFRRTSVQDVAQELGVNRTTVYRQVGNIEQLARMVAAREGHRAVAILPSLLAGQAGPEAIIEGMTAIINAVRSHPVVAKLLADEPELVGSAVAQYVPEFLAQGTKLITPLLKTAMATGHVAPRDPVAIAEWILRVAVSLVLVEPPGDLKAFLSELLIPGLSPEPSRR